MLDLAKTLRSARQKAVSADAAAEQAHMAAFRVFEVLKFGKQGTLTASGRAAIERIDRALDALSDAREQLGDAVYQLDKAGA